MTDHRETFDLVTGIFTGDVFVRRERNDRFVYTKSKARNYTGHVRVMTRAAQRPLLYVWTEAANDRWYEPLKLIKEAK